MLSGVRRRAVTKYVRLFVSSVTVYVATPPQQAMPAHQCIRDAYAKDYASRYTNAMCMQRRASYICMNGEREREREMHTSLREMWAHVLVHQVESCTLAVAACACRKRSHEHARFEATCGLSQGQV